jgi:hypothetical protein
MEDSDWQVRLRAIKLFGRLGRDAGDAIAALNKAGTDPKLHSHVEEAILRITSPESADRIIDQKRQLETTKAQVVVPLIDTTKGRHSQFFRFICPFCSHSEVVGLWFTSKTCPQCRRVIRILRQQCCSKCELIDSPPGSL